LAQGALLPVGPQFNDARSAPLNFRDWLSTVLAWQSKPSLGKVLLSFFPDFRGELRHALFRSWLLIIHIRILLPLGSITGGGINLPGGATGGGAGAAFGGLSPQLTANSPNASDP
jgi:hypothetical protein